MNVRSKKLTMGMALLFLLFTAAYGCGDSNNIVSFTINPTGPTFVVRGGTLQFDTNPTGLLSVTWSVVGGAGNGTIDSDGLYTAPSTLPIDNVVTVEADRFGVTEQATVNLQAADTLAFDSPEKINDTAVPSLVAGFAIIVQGVADEIGAGLGSVDVSSGWIGSTGVGSDVFFSQATDLAPFIPEVNLTNDTTSVFNSLILDQNLNPGIFYFGGSVALQFLGSTNQGASFSAAVPVVSPASALPETNAAGAVDGNNNYHLTYTQDFSGTSQTKYTKSTNQGASWSSTINVTPSANINAFSFPAVSENGQTVIICYLEDLGLQNDIFVSISNNGGTSFATQTNVSQSVGNDELFCRVAIVPNGDIYVAYQQNDGSGDGDILFSVSTDGGSTFSSPITVNSPTAGSQAVPYMSVDDLGRIDIVWADDNNAGGGFIQIGYARSTDGGQIFSNTILVTPSAATTVLPRGLVHDESGRLHFQYFSDVNDPGMNVDFFYLNAE